MPEMAVRGSEPTTSPARRGFQKHRFRPPGGTAGPAESGLRRPAGAGLTCVGLRLIFGCLISMSHNRQGARARGRAAEGFFRPRAHAPA